jgi:MFS transporter, ACS family, glucarate transporter
MIKALPYRGRVLLLLFFLILVTYLDRICISLVGVRIKSEFHLTNEQFGWVLGAFALAYALFEVPTGHMGDRIGQRAVLIRIVLWWSLFTVLTGITTGLISLLAVRFLFGVGEAGAFPNSNAVISRWFPISETSKAISLLVVGSNAGAAVAPLIVVPVASAHGWRAPFFVLGIIGVVWVVVCYLWFRNHPAEMKNISNQEKELIENNRRYSGDKQTFPWKAALRNRSLLALVLSYYCLQWMQYFLVAWMPVYLQEGKHFSENSMKVATSNLFLVGIVSALIGGALNDWLVKKKGLRFGRRVAAITCFVMMGILMLLAGITTSNAMIVVLLIVANAFNGHCALTAYSTCVDIGGNYAGTVVGMMNFFGQLGAFFMAIIFGKIVDVTHSFTTPIFILSGVMFTGSFLWMFINPEKPVASPSIEMFSKNTIQASAQQHGSAEERVLAQTFFGRISMLFKKAFYIFNFTLDSTDFPQ